MDAAGQRRAACLRDRAGRSRSLPALWEWQGSVHPREPLEDGEIGRVAARDAARSNRRRSGEKYRAAGPRSGGFEMNCSSGNVTVMVSNMDASVRFYTEILGLTLAYRFGDHWAA